MKLNKTHRNDTQALRKHSRGRVVEGRVVHQPSTTAQDQFILSTASLGVYCYSRVVESHTSAHHNLSSKVAGQMSSSDTPTSILQSITLNCVNYTCWDVDQHNRSGYDSTYWPHYNRTCYECSLYDYDGRPLSGFPEKNCTTIACETFDPGANIPKYIFIIALAIATPLSIHVLLRLP